MNIIIIIIIIAECRDVVFRLKQNQFDVALHVKVMSQRFIVLCNILGNLTSTCNFQKTNTVNAHNLIHNFYLSQNMS